MYNYKGYTVTVEPFGYTVAYGGEELVFASDKEAEEFIDNL